MIWENGDVALIFINYLKMIAGEAAKGVCEHYEEQEYTSSYASL